VLIDDDDVTLLDHAGSHERAASGEDVHLSGELSGALDPDQLLPEDARPDDLHGAAQHDGDAQAGGSLFIQDLPHAHVT
jgi:hypothetical protein